MSEEMSEREAFEAWFFCPSNSLLAEWEDAAWEAFQAGAAHQRQQAREVVDSLVITITDPDSRTSTEHVVTANDVIALWGRIEELVREKSYKIVMPKRKEEKGSHGAALISAISHNMCLDEFARLNKGAGSHE